MKIPPALQAAWANVRDDVSTANWIICEPNASCTEALLTAKGKTGWADFISHFTDDKILFGGCRCRAVDDRGTTKSVRAKFIFVSWQGKKVSAVQRAKAGTLQGEFRRLFDGTHISIQTNDKEDFNLKDVEKSLQSSTGAHKPTGYEFDGNEGIEGLVDKDDGAAVAASGAASARSSSPRTAKSSGDAQGTLKQVWDAVRSDGNPLNWVMLDYDGKDLSTAAVAKKGYGGLDEFLKALEDDKVLFGGFRCKALDDRGSVQSVRPRFIFISWTGPKVKPTVRAQVSTHKSHFEKLLDGCAVGIQASDLNDLSEKELIHALNASTGAHKPTGYSFEGATEEEIAKAGGAGDAAPPVKAESKDDGPPKPPPPPPAAKGAPPPPPGGGKAPPPPPPPPPKEYMEKLEKQMGGGGGAPKPGGKGALFAELSKGTDITKGLRKVDRSEMRHKNRDQEEVGKATDFSELEAKKAARQAELEAKQAGAAKKKGEPKLELEGKVWKVEWQSGTRMERKHEVLDASKLDKTQAIHLCDCEHFLLEVQGKVNSISMNSCKNTGVMFQDIVASVEVMKSQKVEMQASGQLASLMIDQSSEVMLYATEASRNVEITTCASTALNVTFPDEKGGDADPIEMPLPEQFTTKVKVGDDGSVKLVTVPTSHAD